jgi:dipeptidyl-peptidase-4
MSYNTAPLAYKGMVTPHWMADGRLWYRAVDEGGTSYRIVDPAKKTNAAAFDETKLAAALNAASDKIKADSAHLRFSELSFSDSDRKLHIASNGFSFGAFIRDWNLWVRDLATGAETQLTTDGVKDYGYATDNAGWKHSDAPSSSGRPTPKRSPPSSRTSARRRDVPRPRHQHPSRS